jgi:4-amino-4-deoxy-L-arabinose transferase-like glycosyltransferase
MEDGMTAPRSAHGGMLDPTTATGAASHRQLRQSRDRHVPAVLPLLAVLVVQAGMSIRLLHANTAFQDEALYLWAGHREIANLLHGTPLPPFPAYFSGAPVLYPPLGAMADSLGGLAAARALSMIFMLGATALVWETTRLLYGRRAAFFAAALFALLGPTLHLGAFATYDALAVLLVALACWCVVRAGDRRDATGWMVVAGIVLALANATAYSTTLFDPVVILVALLVAMPRPGGRQAVGRCLVLFTVLVVLLAIGLLVGGSYYRAGVSLTTLHRVPGGAPAGTVLIDAGLWTGLVALLAVAGIAISLIGRQVRTRTWLLVVLTCGVVLGPLEQAHLHTAASLNKHVGLGAWFAAIAAGYAVDKLVSAAAPGTLQAVACGACVVALVFPLAVGMRQSRTFSTDWPNSASFIAILRPLANSGHGRLLVEDPSIPEYYLKVAGSRWQRWSSTRNIVKPGGASTAGPSKSAGVVGPGNAGSYAVYILGGYFSLVALNYADTTTLDKQITSDLEHNPHYRRIRVVPYGFEPDGKTPGTYVIWQYGPVHAHRH